MESQDTVAVDVLKLSNDDIADILDQVAELLEFQSDNPYRVQAYRNAARMLHSMDSPIIDLFVREGRAGLEKLPGIGRGLSASIAELLTTGTLQLLDTLQAEVPPEALFTIIPGIGETLAHKLHEQLGIETLEELETAAHQDRLKQLKGFGDRRTRLIRSFLATMLNRSSRRNAQTLRWQASHENQSAPPKPSVDLLLQVDARYRELSASGQLRTITPRRFNPEAKRWLPIMNWQQNDWSFTAMYSNTALAHDLNKTHDWVVIFCERDGYESQSTVVTETRGRLAGKRVVRGREAECAIAYNHQDRITA